MIEFAVVLMVKRVVEFHNNQTINNSTKSSIATTNEASCQGIAPNITNLKEGRRTNVALEDVEANKDDASAYVVTDIVDFTALFVFFTSYLIFNSVYIACYM